MWLFAALIGVPLIEIVLFVQIGGAIGLWATIAIVLLTAAIGAAMLRAQGFAALGTLQNDLRRGRDPTPTLAHGALLLFAGALLLTPGFLTDAVGFALLTPQARSALIAWGGPKLAAQVVSSGPRAARRRGPIGDAPIEAEYREVDPHDADPHDPPPRR
ncbi:MAG: FxsA family protein [Rhodobacteraceae bacterium]|nr:MAG: FxsA family protein [Paracoccaceae bacterium]